MAILTPQ
jgi:hypothetical protein